MRLALATLLVLASGCAAEEEDPPIELEGELEIGSAAFSGAGFMPIEDGAEVELVPGAQGGFHVWTGLRVTGAMGELYLDREARRVSDGTLVMLSNDQYFEVPAEAMDGWWERAEAAPSFMCPAPIGITIYGTELEFTARLLTPDGELIAEDQIVVTPTCPTGDQEATCLSLCDG